MRYFKIEEFACKCCGQVHMNQDFLDQLEIARGIRGVTYYIESGYRCPVHNKAVGSTSTNHTKGMAADIRAITGYVRGRVLAGLYGAGFKRIGISFKGGFIHADSNDGPESCWLYGS